MVLRFAVIGAVLAVAWNLATHPEELGSASSLIGYSLGSAIAGAVAGTVLGGLIRLVSPSRR